MVKAGIRAAELELLMSDFAAVAAGAAHSVVIEGPPGSGKNELVAAFVARVGALDRVTVRQSACSRSGQDQAYQAAADLLGAPVGAADELPSMVAGRLSGSAVQQLESGPLVLVLTGAEWSDEPSLRWLELLLQRCRDRPLMVVLSQRRSVLPVWRRSLGSSEAVVGRRRVKLGAVDDNDVRQLAARWWSQPLDPDFVRTCYCLSAGMPGLLERLFADLHQAGHRPDAAGVAAAASVGADLLAAHLVIALAGLPAHVSQVALAVAVLGRDDVEPVALLAGVPEVAVAPALAVLHEEGMPGTGSGGFVVCRQAVLAGMSSQARMSAHSRAARVLNDIGGSPEEVSTHLLVLPELPERWMLGVLRDGADRAERRGDITGAARLRDRLIRNGTPAVDDLIAYARVLVHLDAQEAHALIADALSRAGDVRSRAVLAVQFGKSAIMVGQVPEAVRLLTGILDELLPVIGAEPVDADRRLWTRTESALLTLGWNEQATVGVISARARGIRSPGGHNRGEREMLAVQAVTASLAGGTAAEVAALARRAISSEEAPESWMFAAAGYVLSLAGEVDEAARAIDRVCEHSAERGLVWVQVSGLTLRAWIRQTSGDLPGAMDDAELALDLSEAQPWGRRISTPRVTLASILARQGEAGMAFELLDRAEPAAERGSVLMQPNLLMTRSAVCLAVGDRAGALEYALRCGRFLADAGVTNPLFLPWWLEAAPLLAGVGRHQDARNVVEHGAALAERWGTPTAHGLALLARGSIVTGDQQVETLRSAAQTLAGTRARWYHAQAELALGEAIAAGGDQTGARAHFRLATDLAVGGGYMVLAETARGRGAATGPRPVAGPGSTDAAPDSRPGPVLTPSEQRVAELAAQGATNREIAATLVIALRTVEIHLTSAYRKLSITGRAELPGALGYGATGQTG